MVQKFFTTLQEEMAFGVLETWAKTNLTPLIEELDKTGALDLYLKLAAGGGSIWKSALPPAIKKQAKEAIAANRDNINLIRGDPGRILEILFDSLPQDVRRKIEASAPLEYWLGQVEQILAI